MKDLVEAIGALLESSSGLARQAVATYAPIVWIQSSASARATSTTSNTLACVDHARFLL